VMRQVFYHWAVSSSATCHIGQWQQHSDRTLASSPQGEGFAFCHY